MYDGLENVERGEVATYALTCELLKPMSFNFG